MSSRLANWAKKMPNLKSAWLFKIEEGGTLNRFAFLRVRVVLIELFGALGAIKLVAFTGNGGKRKGEEQDGEWFHRAA